ncbi:MAG: UDP-N-acetylglucosamine 1-carboxyvinyltransferase [Chloroherpetonaceae bacterium]|nr:UDP-N-acetylglucosamine 1-carboxyvinyltransferase [Chthonomonadaceae bacterium]MDW8209273.1 UDP-N-acetylglucosamine 1-carboxyvinyltransferase [Chloroherpetonaceae bacterium]
MDKIIICGGRPLHGEVEIGGSKNDAVAIMAATLLIPGKTVLHRVPRISDVDTLLEILRHLGATTRFREDGALEIDASQLNTCEAPQDLVRQMRASFNILGALLTRFGRASVAMPGGCNIGARPVNFHIKGLEELGAKLQLHHGVYHGEVRRFRGANIYLEFPSAGATQHLMLAAACAEGRTIIENCAAEPEIVNLAAFLNACGAQIHGAGTPTIEIDGVPELHPTEFHIIPDRLQAGTYAVAAAITGGDVFIRNARPEDCRPVLAKLRETGTEVQEYPDGVRVRRVTERILPTDIKTMPHPGFPTDMQQVFASLLTIADGVSLITETVYESRFRYTTELERLGAHIVVEGRTAKITGVPALTAAPVTCTDLRGGAALVVAALVADGATEIDGLHHIDRGYEDLVPRLRQLGAAITRTQDANGGLRVCSV